MVTRRTIGWNGYDTCTRRTLPFIAARAPKPIGPDSHAIVDGDFVFVSVQGPIDPATGPYVAADIKSEARRALENVEAIVPAAESSADVSPHSTIGALCIAAAQVENTKSLFNKMFGWGASMVVVVVVAAIGFAA